MRYPVVRLVYGIRRFRSSYGFRGRDCSDLLFQLLGIRTSLESG